MKNLIKKITVLLVAVLFLFSLSFSLSAGKNQQADKHAEVDFSLSCVECHSEETPEAVADWKSSPHGQMNFGCYMCHGDGDHEFYPSPGTDRCIACHSGQEVDFSKTKLNNCFDCHQGHTLKFHKN